MTHFTWLTILPIVSKREFLSCYESFNFPRVSSRVNALSRAVTLVRVSSFVHACSRADLAHEHRIETARVATFFSFSFGYGFETRHYNARVSLDASEYCQTSWTIFLII